MRAVEILLRETDIPKIVSALMFYINHFEETKRTDGEAYLRILEAWKGYAERIG